MHLNYESVEALRIMVPVDFDSVDSSNDRIVITVRPGSEAFREYPSHRLREESIRLSFRTYQDGVTLDTSGISGGGRESSLFDHLLAAFHRDHLQRAYPANPLERLFVRLFPFRDRATSFVDWRVDDLAPGLKGRLEALFQPAPYFAKWSKNDLRTEFNVTLVEDEFAQTYYPENPDRRYYSVFYPLVVGSSLEVSYGFSDESSYSETRPRFTVGSIESIEVLRYEPSKVDSEQH